LAPQVIGIRLAGFIENLTDSPLGNSSGANMKKLIFGALAACVFLSLALPAQATIIVDIYAPDESVSVPSQIQASWSYDPLYLGTFAVQSVEIIFGENGGTSGPDITIYPTDPNQTTFDFPHAYSAQGFYSLYVTINGYFTGEEDHIASYISETGNHTINIAGFSDTPIPAALPLFATALGALGYFGRRRRQVAYPRTHRGPSRTRAANRG
jgi:hypothetical protein